MSKYDLNACIAQYLDRHLVFPLLEFMSAKQIYDENELLKIKIDVLNKTNMVDYTSDMMKLLYGNDIQVPDHLAERRFKVMGQLHTLTIEVELVLKIMDDADAVQKMENMRDSKMLINFLTEEYGFSFDLIEHIHKLAKYQYECGTYAPCTSLLYFCILVVPQTDKHYLSILWGKFASEILVQNWDSALEDLNRLREFIDSNSFGSNLQLLQQRTWLIHWSLFVFFNHLIGRDLIIEMFLYRPHYLNTIQTMCPHILRYLATAVIINRSRRSALKDLIKVIQQESYTYKDPITEFLEHLYVNFDFDGARKKLYECQVVLLNDFFLISCLDEFYENARLMIFETFCRIHQCISIGMLAEKLNMNPEEAECWIVNLIRNARLDAKIDSKLGHVVMGTQPLSPYQQLIEKIDSLSVRSEALTALIERKLKAKTDMSENVVQDTINEILEIDCKNNAFTAACVKLSDAIQQKQTTIHNVAESLSVLLIHKLPENRYKGTLVLTIILENLPLDFLSTELNFLSSFYADRLKDQHQVIPAVLRGISILVKFKNLGDGETCKMLTAMFENVPCQQQQLEDRKCIYRIFQDVLNIRSEDIQTMGLNFILGVITSIDGERDARNLIFLWRFLPNLMRKIPLGHLEEEMFDIISCYFPVDFNSDAMNVNTTRDELANALCPCLCAAPEFDKLCIPLLLEKLDSTLVIAKIDSVNVLIESCKVFSTEIYKTHNHDIFNYLQKEILNCTNSQLSELCIKAITVILTHLSTSNDVETYLNIITNIYNNLKPNFKPETKLFESSTKILLATSKSSVESCNYITETVLPTLTNQYKITKNTSQKEILFKSLIDFTEIYVKKHKITDITSIGILNEIPELCFEAIFTSNHELQICGIDGISRLATAIPVNTRMKLYQVLKSGLTEYIDRNVYSKFLKCLRTFSELYSQEVFTNVVNVDVNIEKNGALKLYLEALGTIVDLNTFTDFVLTKYLNYSTTDDVVISKIAVESLKNLLQNNLSDKIILELYTKYNALDKLINWFEQKTCEIRDMDLMINLAVVIKIIVGNQNENVQNEIMIRHLDSVLMKSSSSNLTVILLEGLFCRLRQNVCVPNKYEIIKDFVKLSTDMQCDTYVYVCRFVSNIINKSSEDENFISILEELDKYTMFEPFANKSEIENKSNLIVWLTKALIMKGSSHSNKWINKLVLTLDKYEAIAKGFSIIMDEQCSCLCTNNFCTVRILYRQRFFCQICEKFLEKFDINQNYLTAFGYVLQSTPPQVIILYFKKIIRLLIISLEKCTDAVALCAILNTLCGLLLMKEPLLEDYIEELLTRFLKLTTFTACLQVRVVALQCLKEVCIGYPVYKLLPHKHLAIRTLALCLDDPKRLVRKQAVHTRLCWFLLGAPT